MKPEEVTWWSAELAAASAIFVVILGATTANLRSRSDRRRETYASSLRTVVAWTEMLYRVRRRTPESTGVLVDRFHQLQEELTFHQGLIGGESKYMARSYNRLVKQAKDSIFEGVKAAWAQEPGARSSSEDAALPDITTDIEAFLRDVRSHLSPWPHRKVALVWRNRQQAS